MKKCDLSGEAKDGPKTKRNSRRVVRLWKRGPRHALATFRPPHTKFDRLRNPKYIPRLLTPCKRNFSVGTSSDCSLSLDFSRAAGKIRKSGNVESSTLCTLVVGKGSKVGGDKLNKKFSRGTAGQVDNYKYTRLFLYHKQSARTIFKTLTTAVTYWFLFTKFAFYLSIYKYLISRY